MKDKGSDTPFVWGDISQPPAGPHVGVSFSEAPFEQDLGHRTLPLSQGILNPGSPTPRLSLLSLCLGVAVPLCLCLCLSPPLHPLPSSPGLSPQWVGVAVTFSFPALPLNPAALRGSFQNERVPVTGVERRRRWAGGEGALRSPVRTALLPSCHASCVFGGRCQGPSSLLSGRGVTPVLGAVWAQLVPQLIASLALPFPSRQHSAAG